MSNALPSNLALSTINTGDAVASAPLRNNYAAIQTAVNQLISCLSGGTSGQLLSAVDGTDIQWVAGFNASYRKSTAKTVSNTTTETDLLNGEITVAANAMGTNKTLRLTAHGNLINNTGSTAALPRFKLKLGSTVLADTGALASGWEASAIEGSFRIVAEIENLGATNSQWSNLSVSLADSFFSVSAFASVGVGVYSATANLAAAQIGNNSSIDTTASQSLVLSVILPVASASVQVNLTSALVEIV